jgi:hypothetical protein
MIVATVLLRSYYMHCAMYFTNISKYYRSHEKSKIYSLARYGSSGIF